MNKDRPLHEAECAPAARGASQRAAPAAADVGSLEFAGHLLSTKEDVLSCLRDLKTRLAADAGPPEDAPAVCIGCRKRRSFVEIDVAYDAFLVQRNVDKRCGFGGDQVRKVAMKMAPSDRRASFCCFCYALHIGAVEFGKAPARESPPPPKRQRSDGAPAPGDELGGHVRETYEDVCETFKKLHKLRHVPRVFEFVDVVAEARERAALSIAAETAGRGGS